MYRNEHGVRNNGRLDSCFKVVLWLMTFSLSGILYAGSSSTDADYSTADKNSLRPHHIALLYSASETLHADIAQKIKQSFAQSLNSIIISEISISENHADVADKPALVIAIGTGSFEYANRFFPDSNKLLLASNPGQFSRTDLTGEHAVLYMSQPYCRQIQLIKLLNSQWHDFSYLSTQSSQVDDNAIQQCARRYDITAHKVAIEKEERLTYYLRKALSQSDLILALPDSAIYNSKSVKNILLTSYRDRKPIIAFSRNFVNAGALAAIHSDTGQIAASASMLLNQYLESGGKFSSAVNYPQSFDISINTQVFRALDLHVPDLAEIIKLIETSENDNKGGAR